MPRWPRPPNLARLFVGQHIINGVSVGLGVVAVALVASAIFGFAAGQPATLGRHIGQHFRSSRALAGKGADARLWLCAGDALDRRDPTRAAMAGRRRSS